MQNSSRHHYVPQFYVRGFTNYDNLLFVYDKKWDQIKKDVSPKAVVFEKERNTIDLSDKSSVLEEEWYKKIDDRCSQVVNILRENSNEKGLLNDLTIADIHFFTLCLFWRIPKTDQAFERFFQESEIFFLDKNGKKMNDLIEERKLKGDLSYKKFARAFVITQALRDFKKKSGQYYSQLFDKAEDLFLLGDYPMVFKKTPTTFDDLFHIDYYLPISSKRIFCRYEDDYELEFDFRRIIKLNAIIIDQSVRYVCCSNLEYLEKSVDYYKAVKEKNLISFLHKSIFNTK